MKRKTVTVEVSWKVFEPGELVTSTSRRCPLDYGVIYEVEGCSDPLIPKQGGSVVFLKGREFGVDTEYLTSVDPICDICGAEVTKVVLGPEHDRKASCYWCASKEGV